MKKSTLYGLITATITILTFKQWASLITIGAFFKTIVGLVVYTTVSTHIKTSGKDKDINSIEEFTNEVKADFKGLNLSNEPIK